MPKVLYDWNVVQAYHDEGHGFAECQHYFGFSHKAWVKAIKRGALRTDPREFRDRRRRYDWAAVQRFYAEGNSFYDCMARFGFEKGSWHKAKLRGEIVPRSPWRPLDQVLLLGSRKDVKHRLIREGILENRCSHCDLTEWRGRPLTMHIDHINGIRDDHRLENLRMLCPNCHSQTETYGGRNVKRRKGLQDVARIM